jgi:dynein intermediate chain 1
LIYLTGCGTTITFHPSDWLIFLVGTEEGNIYKCSTAYTSICLATYEAHHMPVYKVDYNKFYPDIFISCSADWTVKIWEDKRRWEVKIFVFRHIIVTVKLNRMNLYAIRTSNIAESHRSY